MSVNSPCQGVKVSSCGDFQDRENDHYRDIHDDMKTKLSNDSSQHKEEERNQEQNGNASDNLPLKGIREYKNYLKL